MGVKEIKKEYTLKDYFIFKKVFGSERNIDILKDFLESVLDKKIEKIEISKDVILEKAYLLEKSGTVDLRANIDNEIVIIEMQVVNQYNIEKRSTFYGSRVYNSMYLKGRDYDKLVKVIAINILDFSFIKNDRYHNQTVTVLRDDKNYEINNEVVYHYIELPKFRKNNLKLATRLEAWLALIDGKNKEMEKIAMEKNEYVKKAKNEIEYLTGDEEAERLNELKEKFALDYDSAMANATRKGIEQGKVAIIKNMKKIGIDINVIKEVTGMSEEEIDKV